MPTRLTRAGVVGALLALSLSVPVAVADTRPEPTVTDIRARLAALVAAIPREVSYGTVAAPALRSELAARAPFLLDVRDPEEFEKSGHIAGAWNIPLRALLANLDRLPATDRPIVVYCSSGHRGAMAMASLTLLGYTDVRNLAFGLYGWRRAGLPVAAGPPPPLPPTGSAPTLNDAELFQQLRDYLERLPAGRYAASAEAVHGAMVARRPFFLLDVRRPEQYAASGRIGGATNVPLEVLFDRLEALPSTSTPIVVYCASGHRSAVAVMGLRLLGYTSVVSLEGGMAIWGAAGLPLVRPAGTR